MLTCCPGCCCPGCCCPGCCCPCCCCAKARAKIVKKSANMFLAVQPTFFLQARDLLHSFYSVRKKMHMQKFVKSCCCLFFNVYFSWIIFLYVHLMILYLFE